MLNKRRRSQKTSVKNNPR